jgi:hypothetical protein
VAGKEIAVKKYVVRLDAEERDRLDELIRKGKRSAQLLTKARILLKADVSDAGEGWSDSRLGRDRCGADGARDPGHGRLDRGVVRKAVVFRAPMRVADGGSIFFCMAYQMNDGCSSRKSICRTSAFPAPTPALWLSDNARSARSSAICGGVR